MNNLYSVPTRAYGLGLGFLIFDVIASVCIIGSTIAAIINRSPGWKRAQTLHFGLILLSIWTILNVIDQSIRRSHPHVTYSYILFSCVSEIFRTTSNIFLLWGFLQVLNRFDHLRDQESYYAIWWLGIPLWIMGIYFICMQFAVAFAWLNFADVQVIQRLAKAKNGLEIALCAIQLVAYFMTTSVMPDNFPGKGELLVVPFFISVALMCRSFVEVIIVGQLDRSPGNLPNTWRARDVIFNIFSIFAAACVPGLVWDQNEQTYEDPMHKEETRAIDAVTDKLRRMIFVYSECYPASTFPPFKDFLKEIEQLLEEHRNVRPLKYHEEDYEREELRRLRKRFKDWKPICKVDQESGDGVSLEIERSEEAKQRLANVMLIIQSDHRSNYDVNSSGGIV